MLLSIGMIVKNEEKYLEKCLRALMPILEQTDSELIIADTGSTDNTVEIAKRFTDKVYNFEWINDFAAARNFTMEKSSGEWYMFIDADEVIKSCDPLIEFFNTGEYKKYGNASYIIRSYTDSADHSIYSDAHAVRLAKRFDDVCFINPVHEALSPIHEPIKYLSMIADHYGYFFRENGKVTELAKIKSERNLQLLLKTLECDDVEYSVYKEISDCYQIINNDDESIKYLRMGLSKVDKRHIAVTQYYSALATILVTAQRYDETIEVCDDYFNNTKPYFRNEMIASDMEMYVFRGESEYRLGRYSDAADDFGCFFNVYYRYVKGKLNTLDLLYNSMTMKPKNLKYAYLFFIDSCLKCGKYYKADEQVKKFDFSFTLDDSQYMMKFLFYRFLLFEKTEYKGINSFYKQLDEENKKEFIRIIRLNVHKTGDIEKLLDVMKSIDKGNKMIADAADIYNCFFIDNEPNEQKINEFIDRYGTKYNIDMLCLLLKNNLNITHFITDKSADLFGLIHAMFTDHFDFVTCLESYDIEVVDKEGLLPLITVYERALAESQSRHSEMNRLLVKYGMVAAKWRETYPDERNITDCIKAGLIVNSIVEAHKTKDYKICISEMRRLVKACPGFAPYIREYKEMLKNDIQTENSQSGNVQSSKPVKQSSPENQLGKMAVIVKNNIRKMIAAGDIQKASSTLSELESIVPSDRDIAMLKAEIEQKNQMSQMASMVKKNIWIMLSAGRLDSALKTLNELKALVPYDEDLPAIEKEIQKKM